MDFGIAKLSEQFVGPTSGDAPTRLKVETGEGVVMGTASYMSPEQAKGVSVDARTDLWSLGAVIYEMVTGHLPFAGETATETISLILQKEPPPLTRYVPNVPAELERIVSKALTARDLLIDLRNLKRKLEVDAEIDRTVPPESHPLRSTTGTKNTAVTASAAELTAGSGTHASSAEYIVSGIKTSQTRCWHCRHGACYWRGGSRPLSVCAKYRCGD